jgi:hypothetical protein
MADWDANFSSNPEDSDDMQYGANEIRDLKARILERGNVEHEWANAGLGAHRAGQSKVFFYGNTADFTALPLGAKQYAVGFNTETKALQYGNGTVWVVADIKHSTLANLADSDDHTQYLHANKANQEILESINVAANKTLDGRDLSVDGAKIDALANAYGLQYVLLREVQANGVAAGAITTSWANRTLNEQSGNTIANFSINANTYVMTFPIGTYRVKGRFPGFSVTRHQARLFDPTANTTIAEGSSGNAGVVQTESFIDKIFTLANIANLVIQHKAAANQTVNGMGVPAALGENEVYGVLEIWKMGTP